MTGALVIAEALCGGECSNQTACASRALFVGRGKEMGKIQHQLPQY
jgi:hypothetical protein